MPADDGPRPLSELLGQLAWLDPDTILSLPEGRPAGTASTGKDARI